MCCSVVQINQLNLHTENTFGRHICGCFCWLSHIFLRRNRKTEPTQQKQLSGKNCSCQARTRPKFFHILLLVQTPNPLVQALETQMKKQTFQRDKLFPYFLMLTLTFCFQTSRYGILSCLHWILIRNRKCVIDRCSNLHSCAVRFTACSQKYSSNWNFISQTRVRQVKLNICSNLFAFPFFLSKW